MKEIKNLSDLPSQIPYGLTIGNFDGVHQGHQRLLKEIKKICMKKNEKLVLATFVPHPLKIINNIDHFLINSYEERKSLLSKLGIDFIVEFNFDEKFKNQSSKDFLNLFINSKSQFKTLYMGYNLSFGSKKEKKDCSIESYCLSQGIDVELMKEFKWEGQKINSTVIRNFIKEGNLLSANRMLARPFFISGKIKKGRGIGRKIGFLTANIDFNQDQLIPSNGVYATKVKYNGNVYLSITNIGYNPTFEMDQKSLNIETNIFDFHKNIYNEFIEVQFFDKIRSEEKFDSVSNLVERIKIDCQKRRLLN